MKTPAFRFYPADFWGSPDVQAMDLYEVGGYLALLSTAWQAERHGYLPDDEPRLRRWARMSVEQWQVSRGTLLRKFPVVEEGWRANPRMVEEAKRQAEYSASQTEKANKRWGNSAAFSMQSSGNAPAYAPALPVDTPTDAGAIPSVSVSVSVSKELNTPSALTLDCDQKQARKKAERFSDADVQSIWKLWPNKGGKQAGQLSIRRALNYLSRTGIDDPTGNLIARVTAFLAWRERETRMGRFVPEIGFAQGWFGDKQRRYLDENASPPAETILSIGGEFIPSSAVEADGWTVMRGDG